MRVLNTKTFTRYCGKEGITDRALCEAVARAEGGQIDADCGGGVIKQRVARAGGGKSGGFRVIILYTNGTRAIFQDGFAKNEQDNISAAELKALKKLAKTMLALEDAEIVKLLTKGSLIEVECNGDEDEDDEDEDDEKNEEDDQPDG